MKKSLVLDIFADSTAIFSELSQFTKFSPLGTVANILSMYTTAISNAMNTNPDWNDKQKIHENEIDDFILDSASLVLTKWADLVAPLGDVLLNILPDGLNPWKDNPVDLMGSDANDVIAENINKTYTIFANGGNDNITGGRFNDYIDGGSGNDQLYGGEGNDTLIGGIGSDDLIGGSGLDKLYGGQGSDNLYGGDGDDHLYLAGEKFNEISADKNTNKGIGGAGSDYIVGTDGTDYIYTAEEQNAAVDVGAINYAYGHGGRDYIFGGAGKDYLYGGDEKDIIHGGEDNDVISGDAGDDILYGEEGNDYLYGGSITDNDKLYGGAGQDTLRGAGRLEGGTDFDIYNSYGKVVINDEDGLGILKYHEKNLLGANMTYKSENLTPPPTLDFSKSGYDINDKSTGRLVEITRTETWVRYIVTGDINFKYGNLTTETLDTRSKDDSDLGIKFYVTVYKDTPPPPPPFHPPHNPPTRSDPLVLDLNHDSQINTVGLGADVYFDLDGNNFAEKTSWVAPQDGFVVLDLNNNGKVDNGGELFGTDTLLANGNKAADGFQALAQYDGNLDKIINDQDQIYQQLKIWKDINQDGISQEDELFTLSDLGITSISVNQQVIDIKDENNVIHTNQATFTQQVIENGVLTNKIGKAETLLFEVSTSNTVWQGTVGEESGLSSEILALPDFPGYGSVPSLHVVMANDTTGVLKGLVSQFASTPIEDQLELTQQILLYWTNNQHISASETTYFTEGMSKQQFEILKALWGKEAEWSGWPPHHSAARELEGFYQKVLASAYSQLLIQTTKKDWIDLVVFTEERHYTANDPFPPKSNGESSQKNTSIPQISATTYNSQKPDEIYVNPFDLRSAKVDWKLVTTIWHGDFQLAIESLTALFLQNNQLGKIEIEQFHLIVRGLDPDYDVLYKELLGQFSLKAQEISDENLRDLLLESVYALDDFLSGTEQNDVIKTFGGNDSVAALGGDDVIYGGKGDDVIYGGAGNDLLDGGADNDKIYGDIGADKLVGGAGNDYLDGGAGNDTYIFSLGDGQDTIQSSEDNPNKLDRIVFNDGIEVAGVSLKRQGNDLIIKYSENDQITVKNYFDSNGATASRIDQIVFADGTVWDVGYIKQQVLVPTESNDTIQGYNSADQLSGLAGNDSLFGNAGNDTLIGGAGNDYLDGGAGNDTYIFSLGDGQDTIQSYENNANKLDRIVFNDGIEVAGVSLKRQGDDLIVKYSENDQITVKNYFDSNGAAASRIDQIVFADGTVWDVGYIKQQVLVPTESNDTIQGYNSADQLSGLAGNDSLFGNAGNDTLIGGTGNDYLNGATGNDTYIFSLGDGQDVIESYEYNINKLDRIIFREGIVVPDVNLKRQGNDLIIKYSENDQITVKNYFDSNGATAYRIDQIVFADETVWDVETIKIKVLAATESNDVINGYDSSDQLNGLAGNDILYGNAGNDTLIGGTGNDHLEGGTGNDTYIFAPNFGHDIISNYDSAHNRQDIIQFTDGFTQSDFTFRRNNDDLVIRSLNGENSVTVQNYFQLDALGYYRIDKIHFTDNTTLDVETVKALVLLGTAESDILRAYTIGNTLSGEDGDDRIHGNTGLDQLYGGSGLDKLYGGDGNDFLNGGTDSDYLDGGLGNDTYIFARNFGHDTIYNYDSAKNRQDIIQFTDGLTQSDFTFRRNNDDLVIRSLNGENSITVQNYFDSDGLGNYRIDQIQFSDNTRLDIETIKSLVLLGTAEADTLTAYVTGGSISGEAGDDVIYGNSGSDQLYGGEGIDKLYGEEGDDRLDGGTGDDQLYGDRGHDILIGGSGNDQLYGGQGNDILSGGTGQDTLVGDIGDDTYIFERSFGHDTIYNYDSAQNRQDIIQFTDGFTQSDFTFRRNNDDLVIRSLNGENSVTVQNYFQSDALGYYRIDKIHFSDNTTLDVEAVKALVLLGTAEADILKAYATGSTISGEAGDDVIYGNVGSDQIYGGEGLDHLYGGDGDDHLDGGAEDDQLYAGNGNDVLVGGSGNDLLDAGEGADQLYGGTGNDVLNGGEGNDLLDGGDGSDQLNGGTGDDILVGGTGGDVLIGGQGNDIYRFDLGWGQDTLQYESKNQTDIDTIEFIDINPGDLIVRKVGQDMVIVHRTTGDQLIVASQFSDYVSNKPINKVRFDDQTEWDEAALNIQAVKGTELDDIIEGTSDHDVIHAGAGDDFISGHPVYAETPEAQYYVYGGEGNDKIYATGYLDGGTGDDEIEGTGHLLGGEGNDILSGQGVLEGQSGNDILTGQGKLYGGDGQDQLTLTGLVNDELGLLSGGAGDDVLTIDVNQMDFVNEYNQDQFYQDADGYHRIQDTELTEAQRAIYVDGGQGNDTIYGSFGDEVYLFNLGDGQDTIIERPAGQNYTNVAVSFDVLRFGQNILSTDISLHRYGTDLVIKHSNQTDQITIQNYFVGGHHKINEIQFADSTTWDNSYIENHVTYHGTTNSDEVWGYRDTHETFEMGDGDDKVYSGVGNDVIYGQTGSDTLWGQAGNDTLYGGTGADYLEGNEGDDILQGDQGNDILYGGDGNDILYGGDGDDTLRGGGGHDILNGGTGNDKYFYYLTDGQETIDQTGGGTDVLWLMDQGITEDRIKFSKENNDLIVTIDNNANHSIRVKDHFLGGEKAISSVQPNGGYAITAAQIAVKVNASSGGSSDPAGDTIYQYTSGAMTITEQSGNDTVLFKNGITFSQVGNYLTKSGDDLILKVNGSNTNKVTIKNFFKAGQYLVETLQFETGGQLTAEQIFGAFGLTIPSETTPTPPNPVGDTTYTYSSGELTITEQSGNDKVIFKNGITFNQVGNYLNKSGDDLVLKINGSNTNKVTVKNFFLAGNYLVENFEIETGGALSAAQIFSAFGLTLPSTDGGNQGSSEVAGDTVYNYTTGALTITEHSGNDKVIFKNGITFNQVGSYLTKSGDDLILKVNGSNTNKVTVKNFFLAGQYLVETFQFETGGQISAEQIFGAFGITMPQQSAPANTPPENTDLDAFNTTYNYSSGAMVIDEKLGTDQVVFGNGITFSQVGNYLTKSGDDLILKVNGSNSNKVTVKDFFLGGAHEVESFNFETGGSISSQQIYQVFGVERPVNAEDEVTSIVMGDSGDNVLSSDAAVSELFILNEGNDILELLLNASGETAVDYVSDFNVAEDQIDLSQILDSQATNTNLSDYIEIIYDASAKTNTLSVRNPPAEISKDLLIFTNQAESLSIADLTLNQAIIY
ncbi:calcium-binding protein [Acinetobacter sp. NRRL B-65365]|uniref:calcium-binding protein n=1 Tax=Acinetobacter sp. NRRL B-65365 TaxID=1785092 RepID=UPI001487C092|nr:calcium-binding protein [Acinetobacter sp. NRRL B-65365]